MLLTIALRCATITDGTGSIAQQKGGERLVNTRKVKSRLIELGMTQDEAAKKCSMTQPSFNQKVNNVRPMDVDEAMRIAQVLEIPDNEFGIYFFYDGVA